MVVALNLTEDAVASELGPGEILIATARTRDGERVERSLTLDPWQAVVLRLEA